MVNKELQQTGNEKCMPDYYEGCFLNDTRNIMMSCAFTEKMKSESLEFVSFFYLNYKLRRKI